MTELLKLKSVDSDEDLQFYDSLESHIRSLLSLKVDSTSIGAADTNCNGKTSSTGTTFT